MTYWSFHKKFNRSTGSTGKVTMDSLNRLLESDMYDFFAYNKEVVSGTKYTVRVRVAREDLTLLRKVNQMRSNSLT